jgi:hypothetical protein
MWIPLLLSLLNETEMKSMGMKMPAEDIYSVKKGSLKDAIVQFNGGCKVSCTGFSGAWGDYLGFRVARSLQ